MRARIALAHAGIQCEIREVILKDKPSEMLEISPKGTVPVLILPDGSVIDESLDIMSWALSQSDPGLLIDEAVNTLITRNDNYFKYHLDRYKYPQRFGPEIDASAHREQAELFLSELEQCLAVQSNLKADEIGMTDFAIVPFIRQFAAVEADYFASLPYPHLQAWLNRWLESGLFQSVMTRHDQWYLGNKELLLF